MISKGSENPYCGHRVYIYIIIIYYIVSVSPRKIKLTNYSPHSWYNIMHPIPEIHGDLLLHQSTEMSGLRYFRQDEKELRLLK